MELPSALSQKSLICLDATAARGVQECGGGARGGVRLEQVAYTSSYRHARSISWQSVFKPMPTQAHIRLWHGRHSGILQRRGRTDSTCLNAHARRPLRPNLFRLRFGRLPPVPAEPVGATTTSTPRQPSSITPSAYLILARPALSPLSSPLRHPPLHHASAPGNRWHSRSQQPGLRKTHRVPSSPRGRRAYRRAA